MENKQKQDQDQDQELKVLRKMARFDYQDLAKATGSFSPSRLIGKGSHGCVFRGILENNITVAIKTSSFNNGQVHKHDSSKKLEKEVEILSSIRQNPYLVNFVGTTVTQPKLLVMELMPNGSLHELLHRSATPPLWPKRVEIALQVARAVRFLHEDKPLVIHRDIKSANIMFDSSWNARLGDFGLAVLGSDSQSLPAGTMGYLDPSAAKLSPKNDVFSLGVVLLEIICCRKVIDVSQVPSSIVEWAVPLIHKQKLKDICDSRVLLPRFMEGTIVNLLRVAARCVSPDEGVRPCARQVVAEIENCLAERVTTRVHILRGLILLRRCWKHARRCQGLVLS